jgi:hypothetical protein
MLVLPQMSRCPIQFDHACQSWVARNCLYEWDNAEYAGAALLSISGKNRRIAGNPLKPYNVVLQNS